MIRSVTFGIIVIPLLKEQKDNKFSGINQIQRLIGQSRTSAPFGASMLIQKLPQYLADMVTFSLTTGIGCSKVTNLEWSQVDMQRNVAWIHGDQAKAGKPIHVTLNETAIAVLTGQIGKQPRSVFS